MDSSAETQLRRFGKVQRRRIIILERMLKIEYHYKKKHNKNLIFVHILCPFSLTVL